MENRRRHKRYSITGTVELQCMNRGNNQIIHAVVSDISLSGIGLYLDIPLDDNLDVST